MPEEYKKKLRKRCYSKRLKPGSAFLRAKAQSSLGQSAPTWLPGAPPLRAGWAVHSLLLSQMASCRRWRHKKCSHTSFMLLRHTQMAIPFKKPGFQRPDFYSCSFVYLFFCNANKKKCMLSTKPNRHPKEDLFFVQGQPTSADVDTFCSGHYPARFHPGKASPMEAHAGWVPDSFLQHSIKCPDVFLSCICVNSSPGQQSNT